MKKCFWLKSSVLALVATYGVWAAHASAEEVAVQILGVNDFHGALDTTGSAYLPEGKVSGAGTAALLGSYLDDAESEFKDTNSDKHSESIRVQAGDMVGASPANSGLLQDEPTVKVFNEMNFEYGTLGNHEFDEGLAEYNRIIEGTAPTQGTFHKIVDDYEREPAKQEIVIANVVDKSTGEIPFGWKPYAVKKIVTPSNEEVQVGFIGVVTTEIPNLVLRKHYEQYDFLDEAESIAKYSKELQEQGVRALVVLAHVPSTSKDGQAFGDAKKMIDKLNTIYPENSVDVVFAGHNHVYTNGLADSDTLIVQATSQGKAYADVRGVLDTVTKDFVAVPTATVTAVAPNTKQPKASIQAIVDEANRIVKTVTDAKISTAASGETITRELNDAKESAVGNLITSGQLAIARKAGYNVDFAMTNNGGIRADLLVKEDGTITWGAAQAVQPFGNILQIVQMTGRQIYTVLNQQYDEEERYFLQVAGLSYTYTDADNATPERPFQVVDVYNEAGEKLDPEKVYTVVINDFLFGGGDGFAEFRNATLIGAINPDTEVFVEYLTDIEKAGQKVSAEVGGKKTYVKKPEMETTPNQPVPDNKPSLSEDGTKVSAQGTNHEASPQTKQTNKLQKLGGAKEEKDASQIMKSVVVPASKQILPKTGDTATAQFWSLLGLTSLLVGAVRIRKSRENH
ncbi:MULTISPECIES: bifunctional UDP-sugar hydrolase/5'-nucleotidase [unclassified Streptococcus]|uniref:bifunctional metallophosphatase/5'-nucleotidase n=1 Tax=unclassified Streptococcus TaxID=2608887 RepID=UPI001072D28C|nr:MULTISPECIES: bifunctional metallophosphatase/5'-nucleotidase [unclassified Streptococcus]MBF0787305.1 5'-nucleotidase C-terminal domain-containing protein [Streptococcus sp. 19428wC2_LYSM12]MCQ9212645.1 bifunctional metallophosphatase/5'-nucleotidase [Streptococcus sp. B01]MCQ9213984.1 bifunctional metallophosphatase/5'-nucleotidase [Streptococcus sp. O1]TFV05792.1 LPXTG cell wall anchor domain-containing protein [Streptococcus sp. LYSM12]